MSDESDPRIIAARLDAQARRQGAAYALNDVAATIERACGVFDSLDPVKLVRLLRKEAQGYLCGSIEVPP